MTLTEHNDDAAALLKNMTGRSYHNIYARQTPDADDDDVGDGGGRPSHAPRRIESPPAAFLDLAYGQTHTLQDHIASCVDGSTSDGERASLRGAKVMMMVMTINHNQYVCVYVQSVSRRVHINHSRQTDGMLFKCV